MSLRSQFPAARQSQSHYFLSLSRGDRIRQIAIRPWALVTLGLIAPVAGLAAAGSGLYLAFRDEMLATILTRQAEMQYAYEDRLASLRVQLDRVTSRQLLDQDTLEGRVHELASRQAQIETRASVLSMLADHAGARDDTTASIPRPAPPAKGAPPRLGTNPAPIPPAGAALPSGVTSFAPLGGTRSIQVEKLSSEMMGDT